MERGGDVRRRRVAFLLTACVLLSAGVLLLAAALRGCRAARQTPPNPAEDGRLRIATATTAGVYYPVGKGMAELFADALPELTPEVLVTGGGPENIRLLEEGKAELAFVQAGVLYNALVNPVTGAETKRVLRGMTYLYPNVMHLVVRKDAGIDYPADIAGKRYIPGPRESAAEINSAEILSLYDVKLTDTRLFYYDYDEAADALISGEVDGAMIPGGLLTPSVVRMLESGEVKLLPVDAPAVMKRYPWYEPFVIPPGTYPNQEKSVGTVAVANVLVVRADLPEDLVYRLMQALYRDPSQLAAAHPAAELRLEEAMRGLTGVIEPHPGAARFLKEAGVLQ